MSLFLQDPSSVLDYSIVWTDELDGSEAVSTSTWLAPPDITVANPTNTTDTTTVLLSGGRPGVSYVITNRVVTDSSPARTFERSITLRVGQR